MPSLKERFNRLLFAGVSRRVLDTPPASRGRQAFAALSMCNHRDVLPYLVAIKSFCQQAQPERVLLVADPTLDESDKAVLRQQVPHIEILDAVGLRQPALPVGGCWERLAGIAAINAESSIVQVDADTVTFAPPTEVVQWASAGRSFLLSSEQGVRIVGLAEASAFGRSLLSRSQHIQVQTEAVLEQLPQPEGWRYARGCAGFTGFGRGALSTQRLCEVSAHLRGLLGPRWDNWGSEQVTSNLLAASARDAALLPHPRYCNADSEAADTVLAHYIGYARHTNRNYERRAAAAIRAMAAGA
jgi:hypothetical protein